MMNKLILALALVGVGVGMSYADNAKILAPQGRASDAHPLYGGYKVARISSTSDSLVCTGRCILGGLYMSTGPNSTTVLIRDSKTADNTIVKTTRMMPLIPFSPEQTAARGNKIDRGGRSSNGIVARLSSASADEEVYILYIDGAE